MLHRIVTIYGDTYSNANSRREASEGLHFSYFILRHFLDSFNILFDIFDILSCSNI